MKLSLPIYYYKTIDKMVLVGLNEYRNWHYRLANEVKVHYHELVWERIRTDKTVFKKVHVSYKVFVKSSNTDGPNVRSIIEKFFLDALKENGNISDDNVKVVVGDNSEYFIDKENPRVDIEVTEVL